MTEMGTPQPEPIPGQPVEPLPEPTVPTEEPTEETNGEPEEEVPGEEEVADEDVMTTEDAASDGTIDDAESETYPSGDAPPEAPGGEE